MFKFIDFIHMKSYFVNSCYGILDHVTISDNKNNKFSFTEMSIKLTNKQKDTRYHFSLMVS